MNKTIVANFLGGPGCGKSTLAAYVFAKLKWQGVHTELVTEFAKDLVWDDTPNMLKNQIYMFGEMYRRIDRLQDKVDLVLCDGPLFMSIIYGEQFGKEFVDFVNSEFNRYHNINIFVNRTEHFDERGRVHDLQQSMDIDIRIMEYLNRYGHYFSTVSGNQEGGDEVVEMLSKILKETR